MLGAGTHGKVTQLRNRLGVEPDASLPHSCQLSPPQKFPPRSPGPLNSREHQGPPDYRGARPLGAKPEIHLFFFFFFPPKPLKILPTFFAFCWAFPSSRWKASRRRPHPCTSSFEDRFWRSQPHPALRLSPRQPRLGIAVCWTHRETASAALSSATGTSAKLCSATSSEYRK